MSTGPESYGLLNFLWALAIIPIGWLATIIKGQSAKIDNAHKRISEHELHVSENYLKTDKFDKFEERLFDKIDGIQDSLNQKQDK